MKYVLMTTKLVIDIFMIVYFVGIFWFIYVDLMSYWFLDETDDSFIPQFNFQSMLPG